MKRAYSKKYKKAKRLAILWLTLFAACLLLAFNGYFIANFLPQPAMAEVLMPDNQASGSAPFAPFLNIVPDPDGTQLYIEAGGVGELGGTLFVNIDEGPSHDKISYAMTYSDTVQAYVTTATGLTPATDSSHTLSITSTLGLNSGEVVFYRAFVPQATTSRTIHSDDGLLALSILNSGTFTTDAYLVVVPSFAPPGNLPLDHSFVGAAYSVRASGAVVESERPFTLQLSYTNSQLAGTDPHTLAIFAWDGARQQWGNLGGTLFDNQQFFSRNTSRFTSYALIATPTWHDDFNGFSGIDFDQSHNITLGSSQTIILQDPTQPGQLVSQPISGVGQWDTLDFNSIALAPTATLTVDILAADGTLLLANVVPNTNLAALINASQHPTLRLRANLASQDGTTSPALAGWSLSWRTYRQYLPLVRKE
ncbi:MAG: hypothetical protein H6653_20305 [Ardenticatenaceae bacterium]|nr:hypothetical protein [Ardenticatenaceae bacterium]